MDKGTLLVGEPMGLLIAQETGNFEDVNGWDLVTCGAELNVAIGLSRLEHKVGYMTKLGDDPFGKRIIKNMQENRISTELIKFVKDRFTGFMLKSKVYEGDPAIFYFRKNSAASTLSAEDIDGLDCSGYDWIHATGITPALTDSTREAVEHLEKLARKNGMVFSFDPNLRPQLWPSREMMADYMNMMAARSDYFLPGIKECNVCLGISDPEAAAKAYLDMGCKCVIIKLGGDGAYYATAEESGYVPGFKIEKIIDTVGAGDGFAAGVISALKEGLPLKEAVRRGNAIGAIQLTSKGDNDGLPTREELALFMAGDKNWRKIQA
ncbi:MAG: sugar kinase [Oscillospiraceae bacterium]|nr:sugar kinase [Oscillospiraceae bacterium]